MRCERKMPLTLHRMMEDDCIEASCAVVCNEIMIENESLKMDLFSLRSYSF